MRICWFFKGELLVNFNINDKFRYGAPVCGTGYCEFPAKPSGQAIPVSLLMAFPAWQRPLLRLFSNPYYFRFNADLEMSVNMNNIKTIERGTALFEIMISQGKNHP
jgi:hypothetical protein